MQEQLEAVQRMQDYIKTHFSEQISLADLSNVSLFSPWYSHRLFQQYTGISPAKYIRKLRLSKSALKLRDYPTKIADIAFEMGFGSVDGYQRAFFEEFGCNPSEYASRPIPLYLFTPYSVNYKQTERSNNTMENLKTVFIQLIDKPARKVLLKRGIAAKDYFSYCEEIGCDVWGLLQSIPSICGEPICLWLPTIYRKPNTSEYVQGVEVSLDYDGIIPEDFDVIELPPAQYLMFQGEPFDERSYGKAIEELQLAIQKYNPTIRGYLWDTANPRIQLEPIGTRGYIELIAVKPL
ncbi:MULTISPECIES: helix-turn-helix domain-containing protein [unclassified Enterococcus]|uniref:helix-turn-helix domain-containing protein n=1 Tax=unclassified Enterococcus TaxID=2608891 RepID=UPI001CE105E2|nr:MULTISPECIES: AraC family transcriptional regulator [unclassified Enterococcus]MCA5012551.1 helix-turn-helix transcriptional regulator [Enterococcus sp. S23]MCA5015802.1 helix-turn-helix transcriptional regulator [Enterococcus sp. S22(2020)]